MVSLGRQWGAPAPVRQAIRGVDIALWDRLGCAHGKSIAQLLTTRPLRGRVRVYASSLGPTDVATQASAMRFLR